MRSRWVAFALAIVTTGGVTGCSGRDGGGGGGPIVTTPPGDLTGVWDAVDTRGRAIGEIEVAAGHFRVTLGHRHTAELLFTESGSSATTRWTDTGTYDRSPLFRFIDTTHAARDASFGAIPLPLGGAWHWAVDEHFCDVTVDEGLATATCNDPSLGRLPWPLPPHLDVSARATRTSPASSIFGELGGTWAISSDDMPRCTATFAGQTFSLDCTDSGLRIVFDSIEVVFDGDIATGTNAAGQEFMAIRRR